MKFREILKKYIINNIGYKILAVIFSFLLWLVILNSIDPDDTRTINNVPVKIENEDMVMDGTHVYTISSGDATSIIVNGRRSIISSLTAADFSVTANFAELSITNAVPIKVELTGTKQRYAGQITYTAKDTSMLINLENMKSVSLPVELEYKGDQLENIVIDEANISPKKVTLDAPESIADSADRVVVTANYASILSDSTMMLKPVIRDKEGKTIEQGGDVSLDETTIAVEFKVSGKKDVKIIANTSGKVEDGYVFQGLELSQDTITVKGPKDDIRLLNTIVIPGGAVKISGATETFDIEIDVSPFLPQNCTVYGESPTVTITVKVSKAGETGDSAPEEMNEAEQSAAETETTEAEQTQPDEKEEITE